jgi:hypothetical protein
LPDNRNLQASGKALQFSLSKGGKQLPSPIAAIRLRTPRALPLKPAGVRLKAAARASAIG